MGKVYSVKEIYYTLQGEGAQSGRPALFLRFAGCNLWSGREADRDKAKCQFCDTDFIGTDGPGGGKFESPEALAQSCRRLWDKETENTAQPSIILTGGEPMLQVDHALIAQLHAHDFWIGIESNGTLAVPPEINWICISPKVGNTLVQRAGDELKLVFPQKNLKIQDYEELEFLHYFLQPMDNENQPENLKKTIEFCLRHPKWHLSLQTHKLIGID